MVFLRAKIHTRHSYVKEHQSQTDVQSQSNKDFTY
jgi:hypothetical protein